MALKQIVAPLVAVVRRWTQGRAKKACPRSITVEFANAESAGRVAQTLNVLLREKGMSGVTRRALNAIYLELVGEDHESIGSPLHNQED